jgi:hypothetical protein
VSPWIKRIVAALAIREGIERVQEMRQPKRSFFQRMSRPLLFSALGGGVFYLYKNGKLEPMVDQAKQLMGQDSNGQSEAFSSESTWSAPAATTGTTSVGAASTPSSL